MSTIIVVLLAGAFGQTETYFKAVRDFCEGTLSAYEPSTYDFPIKKCFNSTTQTAILDDSIAIATFASAGNWNKVDEIVEELIAETLGGVYGCDVFLLRDQVVESALSSSTNDWWMRILRDFHLIRRYCQSLFKNLNRKSWKEAGFELGSCLHYLVPPI